MAALDSASADPYFASMSSATSGSAAKAALAGVRFEGGVRILGMELAPRLTSGEQRALTYWVRRLPGSFAERLPRLKLAAADELRLVQGRVVVNKTPQGSAVGPEDRLHAASFIPERYLVLHRQLFRRRVELGRILYHELCHFLWPRLGNPARKSYEELVRAEFRRGVRGELGYSSEWRKAKLRAGGGRIPRQKRLWREYVCESFCDTASYVLLGAERRAGHSEYTLSRAARERRRRWMEEWGMGKSQEEVQVPRRFAPRDDPR